MDELLCEYVDGTMDPAVRLVFEEYLAADPDLAAHVESLVRTRALLCSYKCRMHAPGNFDRKLYRELTTEWMATMAPPTSDPAARLRAVAAATSLAVAVALVGLLVAQSLSEEDAVAGRVTAEVERVYDVPPGASFGRSVPAHALYGRQGMFTYPSPSAVVMMSGAAQVDFHGASWSYVP